ncbi:MAG TPA: hypothetical protein VGR62_16905 [Candidatus Binatia bacterium]|nr:hypothetical protein [Candidatus Binatia bacterium]
MRRWPIGVAWIVGVLLFRWHEIGSGLRRLSIAPGDGRLQMFLREHWLRVLIGENGWRDPPMFHPATGTLGYSDGVVLDVLVYGPMRLLGLDPPLALQATWLVLSLVGFVGFVLVCRRLLGAPRWVATVAALLFTFSNGLHATTPQPQLYAVYYLPWLCLGAAHAIARAHESMRGGLTWSALCGLVAALLFMTAYYIAWFAMLAGVVFVLVLVVIDRPTRRALLDGAALRLVAAAAVGFAVGIVPFVLTYLPILAEGRGRDFADALGSAGTIADLINVGHANLLWGGLLQHLPGYPVERLNDPNAFRTITPLVLLTAVAGGLWTLRPRARPSTVALLVTLLVLLALPLRVGTHTPWWFVWEMMPGASAIRLIWRLQLVNGAIAAALVAIVLSRLARVRRPAASIVVGLWVALLLVEQVSLDDWAQLDIVKERAQLAAVPPPPAECRAFVMTDDVGVVDTPNTFALSVALRLRMPTVNGYSGWWPTGWALYPDPRVTIRPSADVLDAAAAWLLQNDAIDGVCRYDLPTHTWTVDPFRAQEAVDPGTTIELATGGAGTRYAFGPGWSMPEPWGRWTVNDEAELSFEPSAAFAGERPIVVHLLVGAFLFGPRTEQIVDVDVNGHPAAHWRFTPADSPRWETLRIPHDAIGGRLRLTFHNENPVSPEETGFAPDRRRLGLSLTRLWIGQE